MMYPDFGGSGLAAQMWKRVWMEGFFTESSGAVLR